VLEYLLQIPSESGASKEEEWKSERMRVQPKKGK